MKSQLSHSFSWGILLFFIALIPREAMAYVDPGSGYLVTQILAGLFLGTFYLIKQIPKKIGRAIWPKGRKDKSKSPRQ